MSEEVNAWARGLQDEIEHFLAPEGAKTRTRPRTKAAAARPDGGWRVKLAVRNHPLEPDVAFEYESTSISKLQAKIEAEKAAHAAGYKTVGFVVSCERM